MAVGKDYSSKIVLSAIGGNAIITVAKFMGWLTSASPSMLAESIHSLADTCNQSLIYVGLRHSQTGPSREFPWGRGNARYLWNLISAVGIFFVGFGVTTYHGVLSLVHVSEYKFQEVAWNPHGILIFAFVVEGVVFFMALKSVNEERENQSLLDFIRKGDNPTTVAVLLEDGLAVLGVLLALIGICLSNYLQSGFPDAIAAIVIGCLLGVMAVILAFANGRLLIGVSAEPAEEKKIKKFLSEQESVEKITAIKTEVLGPDQLRLTAELEFHGGILINREQIIKDAEKIRSGEEEPLPVLVDTAERMVRVVGKEINELERKLKQEFPQLIIIELEVN